MLKAELANGSCYIQQGGSCSREVSATCYSWYESLLLNVLSAALYCIYEAYRMVALVVPGQGLLILLPPGFVDMYKADKECGLKTI